MRQLALGLLVAAVLASLAAPVMASVQVNVGNLFILDYPTQSQLNSGGYPAPDGSQGPFYLKQNGGTPAADQSFLTFCVEQTEYFYTGGHTYKVGGMGYASSLTGFNLTPYDSWLYTNFRNGTMPSAWKTLLQSNSTTAYNVLQYAIWAGMTKDSDLTKVGGTLAEQKLNWTNLNAKTSNPYLGAGWSINELNSYGIGPGSFATSGWTGFGDVEVLNMLGYNSVTHQYDLAAQDQLALVHGLGQAPVPEPISLVVWLLIGLCGCVATYCRQKRLA